MEKIIERQDFSPEMEAEPVLDRKEIAVNLRRLGIDVDFEDWDGLDDNDVLGDIVTLATVHDFDMDEVLESVTPIEHRTHNDGGVTMAQIHDAEKTGGSDEV